MYSLVPVEKTSWSWHVSAFVAGIRLAALGPSPGMGSQSTAAAHAPGRDERRVHEECRPNSRDRRTASLPICSILCVDMFSP